MIAMKFQMDHSLQEGLVGGRETKEADLFIPKASPALFVHIGETFGA